MCIMGGVRQMIERERVRAEGIRKSGRGGGQRKVKGKRGEEIMGGDRIERG